MNENVDIFICTHKDFDKQVSNEVYKVFDNRKVRDEFKIYDNYDDVLLSELYSYLYIRKNYRLKDYIGFCHYRRYYEFLDNVPNIEELFKECDVITRRPLQFSTTIYEQYAACHNIEDLDLLGDIINEKFHDYYNAYKTFVNGHLFIPCNMFIMKKEDFIEYCDIMEEMMTEYFKRFGGNPRDIILKNKDKYFKNFYPNNTIEYQERLFAFVFERFTNIFIIKKFRKIKLFNVVVTENKYNIQNNTI
jgi:hypothetical protein